MTTKKYYICGFLRKKIRQMYYLKELIYIFISSFLKAGYTFTFRNVITTGYPKVKRNKPAIFVANHQNTFMDGVVMVYTSGTSYPNILVRADIFKSKLAYNALSTIKLMPIYRKRDGVNTQSQNEQIFEQCYEIFSRRGVVALFPEGNHAFPRKLRTLQKGAARIAFQAEEEKNWNLNLSIIPVGLQYEHHTERWHDLYVHYGEPTLVNSIKEDFEENPQKTYKEATEIIRAGISAEMIDIEWEEEIPLFEKIRDLAKPESKKRARDFKSLVHSEMHLINGLTAKLKADESVKNNFKERVQQLHQKLEKTGINFDYDISKPSILKILGLGLIAILLLPFYLVLKVAAFIPNYIIEQLIIKKVKDHTWHLSLRFAISAVLFPVYLGILWLVLGFIFGLLLSSIIIFSFPIVAVLGLEARHWWLALKNAIKIFNNNELADKRSALVKELYALFD